MKIKEKIYVLIAEDNAVACKTIKQSLKEIGFEIAGVAVNGKEATDMAKSLCPDVILMDIEMPMLNGLDACREIQEKNPIPVVVLTSHEKGNFVEKANEVGVSAYLVKPPKAKEIERAIIIALGRHENLMECWRLNKELSKALEEIKTLRGIIPLCSCCKKIRDDKGYWQQVDQYITEHTEAVISHGMCLQCSDELYGGLEWYEKAKKEGEIRTFTS